MTSPENSNWLLDYGLLEDIPVVGGDLPSLEQPGFNWPSHGFNDSTGLRMVTQLRDEAQKLKESNENLQEKINELKAEKNDLRDEKQMLKAEKDVIEMRVKALSTQPGFLRHPPAMPNPFAAQCQVVGGKLMPFIGYPGVSMWQFMPPAAVDTSQDHVLRPPVA